MNADHRKTVSEVGSFRGAGTFSPSVGHVLGLNRHAAGEAQYAFRATTIFCGVSVQRSMSNLQRTGRLPAKMGCS